MNMWKAPRYMLWMKFLKTETSMRRESYVTEEACRHAAEVFKNPIAIEQYARWKLVCITARITGEI